MKEFISHLWELEELFQNHIPTEIHTAIKRIELENAQNKFSKDNTKRSSWITELKKNLALPCFSFNGSKLIVVLLERN